MSPNQLHLSKLGGAMEVLVHHLWNFSTLQALLHSEELMHPAFQVIASRIKFLASRCIVGHALHNGQILQTRESSLQVIASYSLLLHMIFAS